MTAQHVVSFAAVHAVTSMAGSFALAWQYVERTDALRYLCTLGMVATVVSSICFAATSRYLSKRPRATPALVCGALCGSLPPVMFALTFMQVSVALAQFLAVFVPGLAAVTLASVAGRTATSWRAS